MIRYSLKCAEGHVFESWFRDSAGFDALAAQRRVACAVCGDLRVEKTLMAPSVRVEEGGKRGVEPAAERGGEPAGQVVQAPGAAPPADPAPLSAPVSPAERALAGLRRYLSEKADYVGRRFVDEARRIHGGEAEERPIWGEATPEDARALREEGVPIAQLPPLPRHDD